MLFILSLVLAAFLLIIISLSVYIFKSKKHPKTPSHIPSDHSSLDPLSMQHPYPKHNGTSSLTYSLTPLTRTPNPHKSPSKRPLSISSDRSEVTTISTVSMAQPFLQSSKTGHKQANQGRQVERQIKPQNKVAPLAPSPSMNKCGLPSNPSNQTQAKHYENVIHNQIMARNTNLQEKLKTNILGSSSHLKRLEWPHASIPRTVKKLAWDDELENTKDIETSSG